MRVFVVVGRQAAIESGYSSVICAPIYTAYHGLSSQVVVGRDEGLKHDSDADFVGTLLVQINRNQCRRDAGATAGGTPALQRFAPFSASRRSEPQPYFPAPLPPAYIALG